MVWQIPAHHHMGAGVALVLVHLDRTADPDSVLETPLSVVTVLAVPLFAKQVLYRRMGEVDLRIPPASPPAEAAVEVERVPNPA